MIWGEQNIAGSPMNPEKLFRGSRPAKTTLESVASLCFFVAQRLVLFRNTSASEISSTRNSSDDSNVAFLVVHLEESLIQVSHSF